MQPKSLLSLRNIPQEVFFLVFALLEVEEDKNTLASCVLVSRLWHDMALPSLWKQIVLKTTQTLEHFLALLRHKPVLGQSVRSLTLWGAIFERIAGCGPAQEREPVAIPLSVTMLRDIMSCVPKLQRLSLQEVALCWAPEPTPDVSSPPSGTLSALELIDVSIHDRETIDTSVLPLLQQILSLQSVGELTFASFDDTGPIQEPELEVQGQPQLPVQNLSLIGLHSSAQLIQHYNSLSQRLLPGCLRSLTTSVTHTEDLTPLLAFLRDVESSSITHLELDLSEADVDSRALSKVISYPESLSTLRLHVRYNSICREDAFSVADIFPQHALCTLKEVHLDMEWTIPASWSNEQKVGNEEDVDEDADADADIYDQLLEMDRVLSSRVRFPALGYVNFTLLVESSKFTSFFGELGELITKHFITAVFPGISQAGLFDIQFAPLK
ncbi:hypothetical protein L226DRAFT_571579 [Lentinus tigrinus ALCF2SS1-7]|uniref:F-box domain-containing protein n=1 Tax=Lentinus tigrinus ALCF2SS1-6 TaxID=1328759 RepID=A0A5C2RTF1_9APHY|nr:hypothetical protein L227DRAFT_615761 [Lentinus tigrinus ALCF2SS1-6]RPD74113.1 hypothetical protein L226DRAFT_571579 [Lentinus tigrinus ALCF2SS1-7]